MGGDIFQKMASMYLSFSFKIVFIFSIFSGIQIYYPFKIHQSETAWYQNFTITSFFVNKIFHIMFRKRRKLTQCSNRSHMVFFKWNEKCWSFLSIRKTGKIFKTDLNSSAFKRLGGKIIFNGSEKENMLPSKSRSGAKFGKSDNC